MQNQSSDTKYQNSQALTRQATNRRRREVGGMEARRRHPHRRKGACILGPLGLLGGLRLTAERDVEERLGPRDVMLRGVQARLGMFRVQGRV